MRVLGACAAALLLRPRRQDVLRGVAAAIADGERTVLIRVGGIGANADYLGLAAALYQGRPLGHAARFDGSDAWPVAAELLADPSDAGSSLEKLPGSYLTANTWVSGEPAAFDLPLVLRVGEYTATVPIRRAIVTMRIAPDRRSATDGVVAGVIPVDALVGEARKILGASQKDLCSSNVFDALELSLRQAADMNADGTNDPNRPCDAVSIGIGFEAKIVQLGPVAPAVPPPPDPCK